MTGAQGCCRGGGLVAGVWVGRATGVVYLPGLGFRCSLGGVGHWAPNLPVTQVIQKINVAVEFSLDV